MHRKTSVYGITSHFCFCCLGDHLPSFLSEGAKREQPARPNRTLSSKQILRCSFEGCYRTFTWPAHLKYHLKTHRYTHTHTSYSPYSQISPQMFIYVCVRVCVRNDRTFRCGAEGCGKSFYVLQRLQVHMRTHNGDKPFICKEKNCGKKFTTAGNLKNHKRTHTGGDSDTHLEVHSSRAHTPERHLF